MGFGYEDFLNLTWREFDYYSVGYERRIEREWDYTRHIIASNYNSSGFAKKQTKANDVMKLPRLDTPTKTSFKQVDPQRLANMLSHLNKNKE